MKNTGIQTLNNLLVTPSKDLANNIAEGVREGVAAPTEVYVALKKFHKLYNLFFDSKSNKDNRDVKEIMEEEILKHKEGNAKTFKVHNAKITESSKSYWDYSNTEDPYLDALKTIEKDVKALIKLREDYHKTKVAEYEQLNNPLSIQQFGLKPYTVSWDNMPFFNMEEGYGETQTQPPVKRAATTLRVTL